ncbi:hypothetical protein LY76DRAFT_107372 [Colletotrichum caudatum]|nr:hypothetical protein LY76DRAFT_107372 [Colletotrichum caudatum]
MATMAPLFHTLQQVWQPPGEPIDGVRPLGEIGERAGPFPTPSPGRFGVTAGFLFPPSTYPWRGGLFLLGYVTDRVGATLRGRKSNRSKTENRSWIQKGPKEKGEGVERGQASLDRPAGRAEEAAPLRDKRSGQPTPLVRLSLSLSLPLCTR